MLAQRWRTFTTLNLFSLNSAQSGNIKPWSVPFSPLAETENEGQGSCQSGTRHELVKQDIAANAHIYLDHAQTKCHQLARTETLPSGIQSCLALLGYQVSHSWIKPDVCW